MARKTGKQLNKNLIAFLTFMGMLLTVAVVGIVARQGARQDPGKFAVEARSREAAADYEKAVQLYYRAFSMSEDKTAAVGYLADAARCAFEQGDFRAWQELMVKANAQAPEDASILTRYLEGLWTLIDANDSPGTIRAMREPAEKLLRIDGQEQNTLALISLARAVGFEENEENRRAVRDALKTAYDQEPDESRPMRELVNGLLARTYEANPKEPRTALAYFGEQARDAVGQFLKARERNDAADMNRQRQKIQGPFESILVAALDTHPGDPNLLSQYVQIAALLDRYDELPGRIARALEVAPNVPEIHLIAGRVPLNRLQRKRNELSAEEQAAIKEEAARHFREALKQEPALFSAYVALAELDMPPQPEPADFEKALDVYDEGREQTQLIRNAYAFMHGEDRVAMLMRGFIVGLTYAELADVRDDRPAQLQRLARAEKFIHDAETRYPNLAVTEFMKGDLASARRDFVAAITAYGRARDKMPPESRDSAVFWDRYFGRQPAEQIAVLNAARNQLGEAEKFARETYRLYDALDKKPPLRIGLILAQALLEGGSDKTERDRRATEALHLLDDLQKRFPADAGAAAVRARALTALGRGGEVAAALASIESGPRKLLTQADVELAREDYAAAAETLRKVFDDPDASARELRLAVSLYVQCMRQLERESDARGVIAALRTREPPKDGSPEEVRRLAKSAEVILSEPDAAKRLDKLAELLKETTDPVQRAWGLADLYSRSDQIVEWDRAQPYWEKAQSYLDEWERLQPDSLQPKEWQFVVALRIARRAHAAGRPDVVKTQLDRAARYIVPLTDPITAPDKVGGAIYRGELALMQAQLESAEDVVQQFGEIAVREFQQAIRTLPRTSDLQMKLARALVAAGKLDDGAAAARTAAEINPRDFSAHRFLFLTYDRLAQGAKAAERAALEELARRHFELAQALNAKDPDVVAFAQMIEDRKQPEKAIARREDRRQRNPGDLKNVLELGRACQWMWEQKSRAGDTAGAVDFQKRADECYQSVAAAAPTDFEWLGTVLEFYVATRERRKGEEVLRNFSSKLKGMQRLAAQIALANFYEKLGDFAAAEQAYRAAQVRDEGGQIIESELIKEAFSDPGDRLRAEARIGFELISLFNRAKMFGFKEEKALEGALYEADRLLKRIGLNPRPGEPEVVNAYRRQARLFLAEGLMRNTKYEESDAVLSAYRKDYADDLRGLRLSIELRLRRKDIDKHDDRRKASEELTEYLKLDPTDGWALYNRGLLKMQMGEYLDARQDFEAALQGIAEPQLEIKARSLLAGVDEAVGDNMPAIEELKRVLELVDARDNAILRPRVVDRLLRLLAKEKRDEAALELLSSYGQRRPDEPYWAMRTGRFLEDRGDRRMKPEPGRAPDVAGAREDYLRAANKYAEAVRVSGGNTSRDAAGAVAARINVLAKADHRLPNDVPEALQLFESIAATDLSSVVRVAGAAALARYKKRDEALRQYETAMLQADLEGLGAALYAADSMRNAFSMAEAEELLRALCTRLPADKGQGLRLRAALATQCVATDKPKDALETLRPVIESRDALRQSAAEDSFGLWSESMVLCGRAYDALQDYAAAEKTYNVLLAEDPEHVVALNNLAWLLAADLNRPREAVEHAERARELSRDFPDRSSILDTVGVAYLRNDRLEDARRALEEAIRLDPATYSSYEHMADVLVRLKQPSEARDWLLRGVAAARNDKAADWERKLNDKLQKLP